MDKRKVIKYKNGLVLLFRKDKSKKAAFVDFSFHAGLINDPKNKLGLSHFIEHTIALSNKEYSREIKKDERNKFFSSNFTTNEERIRMYAYASYNQVEDIFKNFANWASSFDISKEEFENEKLVIKQEILRYKKDIRDDMYESYRKAIYPDDKFCEYNPAGTIESVDSITLNDVNNFIKKVFAINNLQITVYGNVSLCKIKRLINKYVLKYITNITTSKFDLKSKYTVRFNKPNMLVYPSRDGVKSDIKIVHFLHFDGFTDENIYLTKILNGSIQSFALKYFRYKHGLTYAADSNFQYFSNYNQKNNKVNSVVKFVIQINCDQDNVPKVLDVLPGFYQEFQNYLLTDDKLKDIKTKIENYENCMREIPFNDSGDSIATEYFRYKALIDYKTIKRLKRLSKKQKPQAFNNLLKNVLVQKPYVVIVSNYNGKLPKYEQLCKDIKNNTSWAEE